MLIPMALCQSLKSVIFINSASVTIISIVVVEVQQLLVYTLSHWSVIQKLEQDDNKHCTLKNPSINFLNSVSIITFSIVAVESEVQQLIVYTLSHWSVITKSEQSYWKWVTTNMSTIYLYGTTLHTPIPPDQFLKLYKCNYQQLPLAQWWQWKPSSSQSF